MTTPHPTETCTININTENHSTLEMSLGNDLNSEIYRFYKPHESMTGMVQANLAINNIKYRRAIDDKASQ